MEIQKLKQTVYLPVNGSSILSIIEEGRLLDNVEEQEGYFFTPEQLNEYTQKVIKQALETAAENAEITNKAKFSGDYNPVVDDVSITNTFKEIFKKFKV